MVRCKRLKSGIFVAHERLRHINGVNCRIVFKAGYTQETSKNKQLTSIAHLVEHMICKDASSKNYSVQDKKDFEIKCFSYNASTSFDTNSYYATMHKKYLEEFIKRYADYIGNPAFTEKELQENKKVIIEEFYKNGFDNASDLRNNYFYTQVLGTPNLKRLASLNQKDLPDRINKMKLEDCFEYIKSLYTQDNCFVFVCGNVSLSKVIRLIKQYLEPSLARKRSLRLPYYREADSFEDGSLKQVYDDKYKNKNKLYLVFNNFDGVDYTPAYITGDLLYEKFKSYIRGDNSLSYAPYANFFSDRNYGILEVGMDCTDASFVKSLNATLKFFAKKLYKATQTELDEIIERYLLGKNIQYQSLKDRTYSLSSRFAYCGDFRSDRELDRIDKQLKNFKVEDYHKIIDNLIKNPPHLFMICPKEVYNNISYEQIIDMLNGKIEKIELLNKKKEGDTKSAKGKDKIEKK